MISHEKPKDSGPKMPNKKLFKIMPPKRWKEPWRWARALGQWTSCCTWREIPNTVSGTRASRNRQCLVGRSERLICFESPRKGLGTDRGLLAPRRMQFGVALSLHVTSPVLAL